MMRFQPKLSRGGQGLKCFATIFCLALLPVAAGAAEDFLAGADMSHLAYFESIGVGYRANGVTQDALMMIKEHGVNCVRLRLFTSSPAQAAADPYNYINNANYTIPLAVRVKKAGLKLVLDLHYSDSWADPKTQTKPAGWARLDFPRLLQQMYEYNSNTIAAFKSAGALPDYVQIGNEITGGMLWPDGRVGQHGDDGWPELGQLMRAAEKGIKDAAGANPPRIIIHIDRGGDWPVTEWFFDNVARQNISYDIIGLSYYPFWHGSLGDLANCLTNAARRFGKPVAIMETDFPWCESTNIFQIPASPRGQVQYVVRLEKIMKDVPGGLGAGIFWWSAEYQITNGANQAGFGTRSFFDRDGNVLPVVAALGGRTAKDISDASRDKAGTSP